ncbi:DUF7848 domain-containing protein [Streptomyces cyaneofuscatus]
MTRAIVRHVAHTIKQHPDTKVIYAAGCQRCAWTAVSSTDTAVVDEQCLVHAGASNHRAFRRTVSSSAFVVREGEDGTPPAATT